MIIHISTKTLYRCQTTLMRGERDIGPCFELQARNLSECITGSDRPAGANLKSSRNCSPPPSTTVMAKITIGILGKKSPLNLIHLIFVNTNISRSSFAGGVCRTPKHPAAFVNPRLEGLCCAGTESGGARELRCAGHTWWRYVIVSADVRQLSTEGGRGS